MQVTAWCQGLVPCHLPTVPHYAHTSPLAHTVLALCMLTEDTCASNLESNQSSVCLRRRDYHLPHLLIRMWHERGSLGNKDVWGCGYDENLVCLRRSSSFVSSLPVAQDVTKKNTYLSQILEGCGSSIRKYSPNQCNVLKKNPTMGTSSKSVSFNSSSLSPNL